MREKSFQEFDIMRRILREYLRSTVYIKNDPELFQLCTEMGFKRIIKIECSYRKLIDRAYIDSIEGTTCLKILCLLFGRDKNSAEYRSLSVCRERNIPVFKYTALPKLDNGRRELLQSFFQTSRIDI